MALREEFEREGNWLFRWRSYFPFLMLPLLLIGLRQSEVLERTFGSSVENIWDLVCMAVSFSGFAFRCVTLGWVPEGTSGRNTKGQLAEVLNTKGIYSIVRHPLYFGNFLITLGLILFIESWWLAMFYVMAFWLYYERIMFAEEEFLRKKFGEQYVRWSGETPAFIPNFSKWQPPVATFSIRMILKREYSGFLGIIVGFTALKFFAQLLTEGEFKLSPVWFVFLGIGFATFGILYTLRKKTKLLHIEKRS